MRRPFPALVVLLTGAIGCESLRTPAGDVTPVGATAQATPKRPGTHLKQFGPFAVVTVVDIDPADPLFRELEALPDQVRKELKLPAGSAVVQVFLFDTRDAYEQYMAARYPKLPSRRAYFIAEPHAGGAADDLLVFT